MHVYIDICIHVHVYICVYINICKYRNYMNMRIGFINIRDDLGGPGRAWEDLGRPGMTQDNLAQPDELEKTIATPTGHHKLSIPEIRVQKDIVNPSPNPPRCVGVVSIEVIALDASPSPADNQVTM